MSNHHSSNVSTSTTGPALLYMRVSTGRQAEEGMSLDSQQRQLLLQAEILGYKDVVVVREEGRSAGSLNGRPELSKARAMLKAGEASALISLKLDRLSRKTRDVLELAEDAERQNWRLVVLDLNLDTGTPVGRMVLTILAAVAEMERARSGERQADSHAHRRSLGQVWGVTHGPRSTITTETRRHILAERAAGQSLGTIAARLNAENVPTAKGGARWYASTVAHVLKSPATKALDAHAMTV